MAGRPAKWTDKELRRAVQGSFSIAGVLRVLGLRIAGGNYSSIGNRIRELELDTRHWTGQGHLRGKANVHAPRQPLDAILRKGIRYQSNKLRKRLLREGVLQAKCSGCGNVEWLGRPIPLELHHKDGELTNNELHNLDLLCPNCHALTETYRGKNAHYGHIPSAAEVEAGIMRCGSMAAFARERSVSSFTVRSWLRRADK